MDEVTTNYRKLIILLQVTCPNIRLDPSKWVHLRLCLLGSYLRSRLLRAQFPLQVDEKIRVERVEHQAILLGL